MPGQSITIQNRTLIVPDHPIIPFITGDGSGADIWNTAVRVLDSAVEKVYGKNRSIEWVEALAGKKAFDQTGEWLPMATVDMINQHKIAIRGPLTIPVGGGIRSLNVALRQKMDLYAGLRPIRYFEGIPSPLTNPGPVDVVIFRENSEDMYAGLEIRPGSEKAELLLDFLQEEFPEDFGKIQFGTEERVEKSHILNGLQEEPLVEVGIGIKPVSRHGTERLVRAAIQYAIDHQRTSVTLVHKGNMMKFTEGAFRDWGYALAEREFGDFVYTWNQFDRTAAIYGVVAANEERAVAQNAGKIMIRDMITNLALQLSLTNPQEFDVIAALNLNGEYLCDVLETNTGSLSISPAANINYSTGHAIFEVTHGTASQFAGLDQINPASMILAGALMLEHIGWKEASDLVLKGIKASIAGKKVTHDLYRIMEGATQLKCSEFGETVIKNMR